MATEIMSPSRKIKAKVEFYKDSTLATTYSGDDNIIEITIEQTGEQGKFFGFGICQSATVKLLDPNRTIDINQYDYFLVYFTVNSSPFGAATLPRFYPKEITRDENTNNLTVKGYDMLYDAANHTWNDLSIQPKDLDKDIDVIAKYLKATKFLNNSMNDFTTITPPYNLEGTETLRSVLDDAAEATAAFYYCDGENQLVFTDIFQGTGYDISKEDYFTLKADNPKQLANITYATELGDNVTATNGSVGETQYIRDNNILGLKPSSEVATILQGYIDNLTAMAITPYECDWRGNYQLTIGTPLAITAKDNSFINTYLFNQTLTYNGGLSSKLSWTYKDTSESESNPATLGEVLNQTYAKVDKTNKQIDLVVSKVEGQDSTISQIQLDQESIKASVGSITERQDATEDNITTLNQKVDATITPTQVELLVQEGLAEGVNEVTTTTGFTFNQEGLTISKSNVAITTNITEDGMRVSKDGEVVLTANNDGVEARNLHATTYLIIGENSRFEDYDNGSRTGCFWLGG